jgi:hypothetical protein
MTQLTQSSAAGYEEIAANSKETPGIAESSEPEDRLHNPSFID